MEVALWSGLNQPRFPSEVKGKNEAYNRIWKAPSRGWSEVQKLGSWELHSDVLATTFNATRDQQEVSTPAYCQGHLGSSHKNLLQGRLCISNISTKEADYHNSSRFFTCHRVLHCSQRLLMELDLYQNMEMESAADMKKIKYMMEMEWDSSFLWT